MRFSPIGASAIRRLGLLFLATFMMTGSAGAQNQHLTFSLGGIPGQTHSFQGSAGTHPGSQPRCVASCFSKQKSWPLLALVVTFCRFVSPILEAAT